MSYYVYDGSISFRRKLLVYMMKLCNVGPDNYERDGELKPARGWLHVSNVAAAVRQFQRLRAPDAAYHIRRCGRNHYGK